MTAANRMRWLDYRRDQRKATPGVTQLIRRDTGECIRVRTCDLDPMLELYVARRSAMAPTHPSLAHRPEFAAWTQGEYRRLRLASVGGRPLLVHAMRERTLGWDRMTNELRAERAA